MSGKFHCHLCAEFFDNGSDLRKHLTSVHDQVSQKVDCPKCDRAFSRKDNLKTHIESVHREGVSKFIFRPRHKSFLNTSNIEYWRFSNIYKLSESRRRPRLENNHGFWGFVRHAPRRCQQNLRPPHCKMNKYFVTFTEQVAPIRNILLHSEFPRYQEQKQSQWN